MLKFYFQIKIKLPLITLFSYQTYKWGCP